nr:hypothetical protein [uncultured Sphingosinicella sp.]
MPPAASWQHAATNLILPSTIEGMRRTDVQDSGTAELEIIATYEDTARSVTTSVYLFRSQIRSAPLWFDRSRTVLEQLKVLPIATAQALPVRAFALPGGASESGLSVVYPVSGGRYTATGLAVAPLNDWTVKVRMSSSSLDPKALDQKMAAFIGNIRWPKNVGPAPAAAPLQPCPTPLTLKRAKLIKPDMEQAVLGSLFAMAAASKPTSDPVSYCREQEQSVGYGVYRPAASQTSYLVALADSGRAVSVGESPNVLKPKTARYSVTLLDLGRSSVYPSFNRLPPPKQVMEMLPSARPLSSSEVGTTTVSINSGAVR